MKKSLIAFIVLAAATVKADLKFDPLTMSVMSVPATRNIDRFEYNVLFFNCVVIKSRLDQMMYLNSANPVHYNILLQHCARYLRSIKTPTAMRLLQDLRKKPNLQQVLTLGR